ncbi:hypothetical protein CCACVL1_03210 [Corchorus capsularis]|uniref:glutathione transferase n=1 Tax=Corchorus capsularis TaxID=210143 RepID=A0A1R3K1N7_COCAP|nr:hypothetical protein CCACVL1_03210 [Corchorus capsularis]
MAENDSKLKLLGTWASMYAIRVKIALNIKSLEYEYYEEPSEGNSELLLKSNPVHKKNPVLIHGEKPICESLIIVQYIDETWPSRGHAILPSDPYERAIARFWAAYIDEKWFPTVKDIGWAAWGEGEREEAKKAAMAPVDEGSVLLEEAFGKCSKRKPFFGGDQIGFLDIAMGTTVRWLKAFEKLWDVEILSEAKTPALLKWADNFCSHPAVKDVLPETEQLVEFALVIAAKLRAAAAAPPPK